jgi:hypothetical protein
MENARFIWDCGWPLFVRSSSVKTMNPLAMLAKAVALLIASGFVGGCHHLKSTSTERGIGDLALRNNCSSLLYELLEQEKNVSKLLLIKLERPEVKRLIKEISSASATGARKLEELARQDPTVNLGATWLPLGERATRDAISKTRTGELLRASGDDFELRLLLTQAESLGYASHLAKVAAANEPQPNRVQTLMGLNDEMQRLYSRISSALPRPTTAKGVRRIIPKRAAEDPGASADFGRLQLRVGALRYGPLSVQH